MAAMMGSLTGSGKSFSAGQVAGKIERATANRVLTRPVGLDSRCIGNFCLLSPSTHRDDRPELRRDAARFVQAIERSRWSPVARLAHLRSRCAGSPRAL